MNRALNFLLTSGVFLGGGSAVAQIEDNEPSKNLLAMQCSLSSGLPASNYEEYGRKLAKTVGLLNPRQQERVFGYLPRPAAVASGDWNQYGSSSNWGSEPSANTPASDGNPLVAAAGDFNKAESEYRDPVGTTVGGNLPEASSDAAPTPERKESDWWGGLFDWWGGVVESILKSTDGKNRDRTIAPNSKAVGWTSGANGKLDPVN